MFGCFNLYGFSNWDVPYTSWIFRDLEAYIFRMRIQKWNKRNHAKSIHNHPADKQTKHQQEKPRPPRGEY